MQVLSVNVGRAEPRDIQGRRVPRPSASSRWRARGRRPLGLAGDEQADQTVHGGLSKAVYAYPLAHYAFWQTVRAQAGVADGTRALPPGPWART
jgi:MOSC domain-containing protein YiiM